MIVFYDTTSVKMIFHNSFVIMLKKVSKMRYILYTEKNEVRFLHPSCGNLNVIPVSREVVSREVLLYRFWP